MSDLHSPEHRHQADREKRLVALSSLLAAILLTGTKLGVGWWTQSLGILAEAAHSGLDLVAAGITLWAVRISGQPADAEHPYGHGKFENLSALAETLLLLATCVWIVYEASQRLFFGEQVEVDASVWAFGVVVLSIVVDVSRSRALHRAAEKYGSQALEADALHFSTDVWSSAVVLLGLGGVRLAKYLDADWLAMADSVAALGVALIVIGVSLRLGKKSIRDLLDAVPAELQQRVRTAAARTPGVKRVVQVRVRRSGPEYFVDLTLSIGRAAGFEQAHDVADQAEAAVRAVLPAADVVVHLEPIADDEEDLAATIQVIAARHRLGAHGVRVYEEQGQQAVELHVEVDRSLSLAEAHRQASEFEQELRAAVPGLHRVVTHIEPAGDVAPTAVEPADEARVQTVISDFLAASSIAALAHEVRVQRVNRELSVSLHLTLKPTMSITEAHAFTGRLEEHLRRRVPAVGRVVIHVEPAENPAEP